MTAQGHGVLTIQSRESECALLHCDVDTMATLLLNTNKVLFEYLHRVYVPRGASRFVYEWW